MIPGITFVQELKGIQEYRLNKNGLRILLAPDETQPVAGCMLTYHVGSRNEALGYTGATHMLEHLLFKGTPTHNKKKGTDIRDLLERNGAYINATTWFDRTNYFAVMPATLLPASITIEADRMRNAWILERDRQAEMTIVRNEYEQLENEPYQALDTAIWAAAFLAHPYHHPTIGWRSDIESISIERLQQFYNEFYWPDNATITIAGGFDTKNILKQIKTAFGEIPKNPQPYPGMHTLEPVQQGERRVSINRNGFNLFGSAYKMPSASHPDIPALAILGLILMDGKTSRLHRALVDTNKATTVGGSWDGHIDPGLFQIWVSLSEGVPHGKVEESIQKEIAKIAEKPVSAAELKKAQISMRTSIATRRDGVYAFLESVNDAIAVGDWTQFVTLPEKYQKVTVKDVQRVARMYLVKDQSTVGWFINNS